MIVLRFSPVNSGLFSFKMSKTRSANEEAVEMMFLLLYTCVLLNKGETGQREVYKRKNTTS